MPLPNYMSLVLCCLQRNTTVKDCFVELACILWITFCNLRSEDTVLPVRAAFGLPVYIRTCLPLKAFFCSRMGLGIFRSAFCAFAVKFSTFQSTAFSS